MLCQHCECLEYIIPGLDASQCPSCGWVTTCDYCKKNVVEVIGGRWMAEYKTLCYPCAYNFARHWEPEKKNYFHKAMIRRRFHNLGVEVARAKGIETISLKTRRTDYADLIPDPMAKDLTSITSFSQCLQR